MIHNARKNLINIDTDTESTSNSDDNYSDSSCELMEAPKK